MDSPCIKQTVCKVLKIFQYGKYLVAYVLKALFFMPGSTTKFSVNPGMCMSSCCAFCRYMVLYDFVNGGLDVFPHAVDGVEG